MVNKLNIARCSNCGEILDIIEFDETEGFSNQDKIKK